MKRDDIEKPKKKSHCLRNCLISTLVIIVVLTASICGGAYFAYEHFARPILGISLFETFDVIGGLGKYKESDIVTNPYTEEDRLAFYSNFEQATYIDLPEDFSISSAVNAMLATKPEENVEGESAGGGESAMAEGDGTTPEGTTPDATTPTDGPLSGLNDFTTGNEYLDNLLKKTEFNFSKLQDYENTGKDLVLEDKQFAAIMNEVLQNLDIQQVKDIETKIGVSIKDLVSIKQVEISAPSSAEMVLMSNALEPMPGTDAPTLDRSNVKISLVLCIEVDKNIKTIMKTMGMPDIVGGLANMMLPKQIFIGMGVYPYDDTKKPDIFINGIKDDVMANLQTAVSGILKATGSEKTMDDLLLQVSSLVTKTVDTMEGYVGKLTFLDSSLTMDPIALLMTALKVNPKNSDTGEITINVNRHNFFKMLEHIYAADNSIIDDKTIDYIKQSMGDKFNAVSDKNGYSEEITEFSNAFGIDTTALNMAEWNPDEFITRYNEIPAHIDITNTTIDGKHVYDLTQEELQAKTSISDSVLGYIMNGYLDSSFNFSTSGDATKPEESPLSKLPFKLSVSSIKIYRAQDGVNEFRLDVVIGLDTTKLMESMAQDSVLRKLIESIIPDNLYMRADVPLTKNAGQSGIGVNFTDVEETKDAFDTIYSIVDAVDKSEDKKIANMFKIDELLNMIDGAIKNMLDQIDKVLADLEAQAKPQEPAAPLSGEVVEEKESKLLFGDGCVILPTVYDMIAMVTGNKDITANDIQPVLREMYTYDDTVKTQNQSVLDDFIVRELEGKMYLRNDVDANGDKFFRAETLLNRIGNLSGDIQSAYGVDKMLRARDMIEDEVENVDSLKLMINVKEVAAMIDASGQLSSVVKDLPYNSMNIADNAVIVETSPNVYKLSMTLRAWNDPNYVPPADAPAKKDGPMGIKLENILPSELQISASIMLSGADKNKTSITINTVSEHSKAVLDLMLQGLVKDDKGESMTISSMEKMISDKMSETMSKFEAQCQDITFNTDNSGNIVAMSIYDVIYDKMIKDKLTTEEDKAAITPQVLMEILKQTLATPTVTHNEGVTLDARVADINNKMLLTDGTIKVDNVFGSMNNVSSGANKEDNIMGLLDTSKIWNSELNFDTASKMDIFILENELVTIMRQEMSAYEITGLPVIFSKPAFENLSIIGNDKIKVEMSTQVDKTSTDANYKDILPFMPNTMLFNVTINLVTGEESVELLMNDLTSTNLKNATIIMNALSTDFDMESIKTKVNEQISSAFNKLENIGLPISFVKGATQVDNKAVMGNIYDVIIKTGEDPVTHVNKFGSTTDEQLHEVMRGLFAPPYVQSKAIFNDRVVVTPSDPPVYKTPDLPKFTVNTVTTSGLNATVEVTDEYIAYGIFKGTIKSSTSTEADGVIRQIAVLSGNGLNGVKTNTSTASQYATAFTDTCNKALVVTIEVNSSAYKGAGGSVGISKKLPSTLTVTAILEANGTTSADVIVTPLINNMTKENMAVLELLMDGNDNIMKNVSKMVKEQVLGVEVIKAGSEMSIPLSGISTKVKITNSLTLSDVLLNADNIYNDKTVANGEGEYVANNGVMGTLSVVHNFTYEIIP